MKRILKKIK